jgi:murein L,D-transpeptidase YcbB/YkuD
MLRLLAAVFAGVVFLAVPHVPASAKGSDAREFKLSSSRAQWLGERKDGEKRKNRRRWFLFSDQREPSAFWKHRKSFRKLSQQERQADKRKLQAGKPKLVAEKRKSRKRLFTIDPEPVRMKSPDDGYETYRPVELVALSDPELAASPSAPIAIAILEELRRPDTAPRVTAKQKQAIVDFYRLNSFAPLWVTENGLRDKTRRTLALYANSEQEGLNPSDYLPTPLGSFEDASEIGGDIATLARFDLAMSATALRYAEHLHSGRIVPTRLSGYYDIEPPKLNLTRVMFEVFVRREPDFYLAALAPTHPAYSAMRESLAELRKVSAPSATPLLAGGPRVKLGRTDDRVPTVRARMVALGYLTPAQPAAAILGVKNPETVLDEDLSNALSAFQAANHMKQTGFIDEVTVASLNAQSGPQRAKSLVLNMERLRWLPRDLGRRHVFVNQAAFEMRLIDDHDITWRTKVIVGKRETQTAVFSDKMERVVINPYWGVPQSIIRHEMMPRLAKDRRYLDRLGYEVVNERGQRVSSRSVNWWAYGNNIPFGVRQPPGDGNALGRIKFLFPNSHDIYMHDTPDKELFDEPVRAFSHGCVRVENPRQFASYALGWERDRINDMIATGENRSIGLANHIPVHLQYFTAWTDESGKVVFYSDIYGRDSRLSKALDTIGSPVSHALAMPRGHGSG